MFDSGRPPTNDGNGGLLFLVVLQPQESEIMDEQNHIKPASFFPKTGILGGGQLGKMLALAAANWHMPINILDASVNFPAAPFANRFEEGDFANYEDV